MQRTRNHISKPYARRGFTLAEALLASTILAIIAATATLPFSAGVQNATEAGRMEQAVELGESMMEEVLARSFFGPSQTTPTPGPESGETTRMNYDSVDDFAGYSESDKVLRNFKSNAVGDPSTDGFWREVAVAYVTYPNQQPGDTNSLIRVTVKVYYQNTLLVTLDRLVSRED
ncbi:MAG: prepilin-type N-terminal cleavage/methylation domain-containing protein [Planctomycetes bacterium]|nr:prepilin-type N-terminal cleavage/methylation domain-containing protein [Planctomycetota bacterium]